MGYYNGYSTCTCGLSPENAAHILQCHLLSHLYNLDDLIKRNKMVEHVVVVCHDQVRSVKVPVVEVAKRANRSHRIPP